MNENIVEICGQIVGEFVFDHEVYHEKFYRNLVEVKRSSGVSDVIPIVVSEKLLDLSYSWDGEFVELHGQYRSWNRYREDGTKKLELYVFVEHGSAVEVLEDKNYIELSCVIVKEPKYRTTPKGRTVADVIVAANRAYGKTDYIPLIFWGRNSHYISTLEVGTRISIVGRIQSREYRKQIGENEYETRVAYEVSVQNVWEV